MATSCDKQHAAMYKITSNLVEIDVKQLGVGQNHGVQYFGFGVKRPVTLTSYPWTSKWGSVRFNLMLNSTL